MNQIENRQQSELLKRESLSQGNIPMKKRYVVTILSLLFVFGFLLIYHAWSLFHLSQKITDSIKQNLVSTFKNQLAIEDVDLGWGRLYLENITFSSTDQPIEIWVEDVSVEYDLKSFIFGGFRLKKTDKTALINKPRITIVLSANEKKIISLTELDPAKTLQPVFESITKYSDYIQNIEIVNGEIYQKDAATGQTSKILEQMNGSAQIALNGKALASVAGLFVADKQYVILNTALDFRHERLDSLTVNVNQYKLNENFRLLSIPYVILEDGVVNAEIKAKQFKKGSPLVLSGNLSVNNGRFHLKSHGITFDSVQVKTTIAGNQIRVYDTCFLLNGSPTTLNGYVRDIFEPELDLLIDSPEFNVGSFLKAFFPGEDFPLSGEGKLQIALTQSMKNPEFSGVFIANDLKLANQKLRDVELNLSFSDSVWTIQEFTAKNFDSAIQGWGKIHFGDSQNTLSGTIVAEGDFARSLNAVYPLKISSARGTALAEIRGTLNAPVVNGKFAFELSGLEDKKLDLRGNFDIKEWDLTFAARTKDEVFSVNGTIDNLHEDARFSLNIENVTHLGGVFNLPLVPALRSRYRLDAKLEGKPEILQLQLTGYAKTSKSPAAPEFFSSFLVKESFDAKKQIEGTISLYPNLNSWFSTKFRASYTDSVLSFTKFGNERWLKGDLRIDLHGKGQIMGKLRFQNVELEKLTGKNEHGVPKLAGRGFGEIKLHGTLENPAIDANGWIIDGYLNGLGVFNAEASAKLEDNILRLVRFDIKKNDRNFLQCKGQVELSNGMADFRINGQNLDANTMIYALAGKDSVLTGTTNIAMRFLGDTWPIPAYGVMEVKNGTVLWFGFDELKFDLGAPGDEQNGSYLGSDGLYIGRIAYLRGEEFVAEGDAKFPINKQDNLSIKLTGTGNFLSLLPDVLPLVKNTRGIGQVDLELLGPYGNIKLHDSRIKIYDGAFDLYPIAKEVSDITAEIATVDSFIDIKAITGKIDGTSFLIKNYREIAVENGRPAEPLIVNYDWMNLGILEITSEAPGLPLHIPAVMDNGEIGRFVFKGQEIKESELIGDKSQKPFTSQYGFIVAGPWKHPLFRGEVVLNYTNVTYPFLESEEPPSPIIVNLLMNADWDVRTIAGKENNYIRNINYGISNVYVNIGIDDQVSRLHFTGIAIDTTSQAPGAVELSLAPEKYVSKNGANHNGSRQDKTEPGADVPLVYRLYGKDLKDAAGPDTSSFRISGSVESTRGTIEYLDLTFRVDKFGAAWDKSELQPVLFGRAWATVPDSLNYSRDVFLEMYARDPVTGVKSKRGRMEDIYFDLESDYPIEYLADDYSRVHLLAALGISLNDVQGQATDMLTSSADKVLFQQIVRPIERQLERSLGLDIVRLNSRFTRNFLQVSEGKLQSELALALLRSTKLTIGKYLSKRMYLLYTGQVAAWPLNYGYTDPTIGLRHTFGFEYRINPTLLLQMEYDYNSTLADQWKEDKRIWLRHSFPF
jgi:hypothetical protein